MRLCISKLLLLSFSWIFENALVQGGGPVAPSYAYTSLFAPDDTLTPFQQIAESTALNANAAFTLTGYFNCFGNSTSFQVGGVATSIIFSIELSDATSTK